ncbi:MAG: 3-oxoacyl-[acyl-carrier-protein] reductase [Chloroflexi bacterium]|nr:3-oxoacyl-[acyl-carrier-protein] reductase [Chloroflexota bacterium]
MASHGRLVGARTLVTGASGALGRAFARRLAAEGADLVLHYNSNAQQADALASEIHSNGGSAVVIGADLSTVRGAELIVDQAQEALGGLDVLVNNAGTTRDNLLMRMSDEQWDTVMNTNLRSAFVCSRRAVRGMIRQRSGRIINIASVVGLRGNAGQANYAAAKAGLIGFTRALAQEVGSRGITVNAVAPGFVISPLTDVIPNRLREQALNAIPLGRFADPDDIAGAVAFLASDDGAYVTGHVLTVDGGLAMG